MKKLFTGLAALAIACAPAYERAKEQPSLSSDYAFEQRNEIQGEGGRATYEQLGAETFDFTGDKQCEHWRIIPGREDTIVLVNAEDSTLLGELVRVPAGARGMRVQYTNKEPVLIFDYGNHFTFYRNTKVPINYKPKPCK